MILYNNKKNYIFNFTAVFLCIVVAITFLSQYPIQNNSSIRLLMYMMWALFGIYIVFSSKIIKFTCFSALYAIIYIFLFLYCCFLSILGFQHIHSGFLYAMIIPLCMYIIGTYLTNKTSFNSLKLILIGYIIFAFLLGGFVVIQYIPSLAFWLDASEYLYSGKNSLAQILMSAALIVLFFKFPKKWWCNVIRVFIAAILIFFCALLQCRTALLGLFVAIFLYSFFNKKIAAFFWIGVVIAVFLILLIPKLYEIVEQALGLNRTDTSWDGISSGRLSLYKEALMQFFSSPFIGTGDYYVDNFYLAVLTELGVIGGIPIILLFLVRIIITVRTFLNNKKSAYNALLFCLIIFYFIESLLECYPPFGPGVTSFMFWILCGYFDMYNSRKKKNEKQIRAN